MMPSVPIETWHGENNINSHSHKSIEIICSSECLVNFLTALEMHQIKNNSELVIPHSKKSCIQKLHTEAAALQLWYAPNASLASYNTYHRMNRQYGVNTVMLVSQNTGHALCDTCFMECYLHIFGEVISLSDFFTQLSE